METKIYGFHLVRHRRHWDLNSAPRLQSERKKWRSRPLSYEGWIILFCSVLFAELAMTGVNYSLIINMKPLPNPQAKVATARKCNYHLQPSPCQNQNNFFSSLVGLHLLSKSRKTHKKTHEQLDYLAGLLTRLLAGRRLIIN